MQVLGATEGGQIREEIFDMAVLSVGLAPNREIVDLSKRLGIELNDHQFAQTGSFTPVSANREGVYLCGVFQGPKDIPQSVMEASAAAAASGKILAPARGTMTRTKELPPELEVLEQETRIGVFVCNCGINIGGVADVPAVREYAATLPQVVHVEDNLFTCSQDTQDNIKEVIKEKRITRVVVASCSPRTHEPLFQDTIRAAGLNKYLFEMANIRDQNTWVHMNDPARATEKAKDLVRMAVAKAGLVEPLHQINLDVTPSALVIGGGAAGMEAALGIAEQGYQAYLVEKSAELGGVARRLRSTWKGEAVAPYLRDLIKRVQDHPLVEVHLETSVQESTGIVGNFATTVAPVNLKDTPKVLRHGATILATGGKEYEPKELFELFKLPVSNEGFLIEAHMKLRPVDFATDGIYMTGLAHYPKPLDESIAQSQAAVARAVTVLSKPSIPVGGVVASVDPDRCAVCLTCVRTCPYGVPRIGDEGHALIDPAECRGCGACVAECPGKAISLQHFTDAQIIAKEDALFQIS